MNCIPAIYSANRLTFIGFSAIRESLNRAAHSAKP